MIGPSETWAHTHPQVAGQILCYRGQCKPIGISVVMDACLQAKSRHALGPTHVRKQDDNFIHQTTGDSQLPAPVPPPSRHRWTSTRCTHLRHVFIARSSIHLVPTSTSSQHPPRPNIYLIPTPVKHLSTARLAQSADYRCLPVTGCTLTGRHETSQTLWEGGRRAYKENHLHTRSAHSHTRQ